MTGPKYLFLVSKDAGKLQGIVEALTTDCAVYNLNFFLMVLKYLTLKLLFRGADYGDFDTQTYDSLIKNNLQRKLIRNRVLFSFKPLYALYRRSMLWKCHVLKNFLDREFEKGSFESSLIWNGSLFPQSMVVHRSRAHKVKTVFFENGHFPNTIQADGSGINYNSSVVQDPKFYLNLDLKQEEGLPPDIGIRYTKLNYSAESYNLPEDYIFVPFQVPSDMQVLDLSPWIKNMNEFYNVLYQATLCLPDLKFVIKEHPSFRILIKDKVQKSKNIVFANGLATKELIERSRAVITINSTVGMEALLLKKKVITLGLSMYNVEGLVQTALSFDEFIQSLKGLDKWDYSEELRQKYLKFIYNRFLIQGSYQDITSEMIKKIGSL